MECLCCSRVRSVSSLCRSNGEWKKGETSNEAERKRYGPTDRGSARQTEGQTERTPCCVCCKFGLPQLAWQRNRVRFRWSHWHVWWLLCDRPFFFLRQMLLALIFIFFGKIASCLKFSRKQVDKNVFFNDSNCLLAVNLFGRNGPSRFFSDGRLCFRSRFYWALNFHDSFVTRPF